MDKTYRMSWIGKDGTMYHRDVKSLEDVVAILEFGIPLYYETLENIKEIKICPLTEW